MNRRKFIRDTALGGGTAACLASMTAFAQTPSAQWKMQATFARGKDDSFSLYENLASRVATVTGGKFKIQILPENGAVPTAGLIEELGKGGVDAAITTGADHVHVDKSFAFLSGLPFGMNARLHYAWYRFGGGREVLADLFAKYQLVHLAAGNAGAQMAGFFKKEIKTPADLNGVKMRIGGLGADILAKLGVAPQQVAAADVAAALRKGALDAAEAHSPVIDEPLGLQKDAKFYYTLGFWDYSSGTSVLVNRDKWAQLPDASREALIASAYQLNEQQLAYFDARNADAVIRLSQNGAQLRMMPREVLAKAYDAAFDLYETEAARNPMFKKIYAQWLKFRDDAYRWDSFNEFPMDQYVVARIASRRKDKS